MTQPVLIIHGGAGGAYPNARRELRIRKKMKRILRLAHQTLLKSGALEAVTHAVQLLEDDPDFNAGRGSLLQADGKARLSASIMDGKQRRFAGVINLEKIQNPVRVAQALLSEKDRVLAGQGAFRFAVKKLGMRPFDPRTPAAIRRWKKQAGGFDTVGACALDRDGRLASATSTGGRGFERPGRVSDTGTPAANYANNHCAVSATGIGEEILEEGLAVKIAARVEDGMTLKYSFRKTFRELKSRKRKMGAIGLDRRGNTVFAATTESLAWGIRNHRILQTGIAPRITG